MSFTAEYFSILYYTKLYTILYYTIYYTIIYYTILYLADPAEARGCSTNMVVNHYFIII